MLWSDVSQWGWTGIQRLRTIPCTTRHYHYHCLRETLKVTVYHAGTSQDNDGRADKTGLDLDAYECVGGLLPRNQERLFENFEQRRTSD